MGGVLDLQATILRQTGFDPTKLEVAIDDLSIRLIEPGPHPIYGILASEGVKLEHGHVCSNCFGSGRNSQIPIPKVNISLTFLYFPLVLCRALHHT